MTISRLFWKYLFIIRHFPALPHLHNLHASCLGKETNIFKQFNAFSLYYI